MSGIDRRYHSGKFCPIIRAKCRPDCVSLLSFDFCRLIDGTFSLSRRIEDFVAETTADRINEFEERNEVG
jgi:hypothetical protein